MKFLKNNLKVIIAFFIGVILTGGIVYAAVSANQISYTTNKNVQIQTVEDALNDLYARENSYSDILWKNPNLTAVFLPTTLQINLDKYSSVIIIGIYAIDQQDLNYSSFVKINKNSNGNLSSKYGSHTVYRNIIVNSNNIEIGAGVWVDAYNETHNNTNDSMIPAYIIGIK